MRNLVIVPLIVLSAAAFFFLKTKTPVNELIAPYEVPQTELVESTRYVEYTPERFAQASSQKRILFFYADWCPTCRPANMQFESRAREIPEDIVLFKVNYDTETELKAKYGITYEHTFVQVDDSGKEITKWNGGDIEALLSNIE